MTTRPDVSAVDSRVPIRAYTVKQVAAALQISEEHARILCTTPVEDGGLESFRAGRYIRVRIAALDEFERRQPASA